MVGAALLLWSLAAAVPVVAVMPASDAGAQHAIRAAVAAGTKLKPVDDAALARLLQSAVANGITCDPARADCATRICAFGGLDFVIVTRLDDKRATLALHDCVDGREVRSVSALLGDGEARADGFAALTHAVLAESDARGRLTVTAPADGVVVVDGEALGKAPLAFSLSTGPHEVAWRPAHGAEQRKTIEVPAAATAAVSFGDDGASSSASSSSSSQAIPLAAVGAGVGTAVAIGAVVGALVVAPGERAQYTAREYNDGVTLGRVLLGVAVVGAVVAGVAGAAWMLAPGDAVGGDAVGATAAPVQDTATAAGGSR